MRLYSQRPGNIHTLPLSSREFVNGALTEVQNVHLAQGFFHLEFILVIHTQLGEARFEPAHTDHVPNADWKILIIDLQLRHVTNRLASNFGGFAHHAHTSFTRLHQAQYNLDERGFSAAIGTNQANEIITVEGESNIFENTIGFVASPDVLEGNHRFVRV